MTARLDVFGEGYQPYKGCYSPLSDISVHKSPYKGVQSGHCMGQCEALETYPTLALQAVAKSYKYNMTLLDNLTI